MQITRKVLFVALLLLSSWLAAADKHHVLDISVQSHNGRIAAAITLSAPVTGNVNLAQWLSIETLTGSSVSGAWVLGDKAKTLYFTNIEPETDYVVAIKAGLPMANWALLDKGRTQSITVPAITPMLGFAGNGNLLADGLSDGLPVISVNALRVDVDFYRIPQSQLVSFLHENQRRGQQDFWHVKPYIDKFEHIYTARFDLKLLKNQSATSYLPINEIEALQGPGVYLAIMRKAGEYDYSHPATWFAISDLGVHLRLYRQNALVNVSSLATALAKPEVSVKLLNTAGKILAKGLTDHEGNLSFSREQLANAKLLIATQDKQSAIVRLFGAKLDLSEFPIDGKKNAAQQLFIYSPRDLYRPGENLKISALLRDSDGLQLPAQVLTFKLQQPDGRVVSEQRIRPNALGYYASDWLIPEDGITGLWSVSAQIPGQTATSYPLQIEDFLPQRMDLNLEAPEFVDLQDAFQVAVDGQYLYGAPASGNLLQSELVIHTAAHPFKDFEDYHFSHPNRTAFNRRETLPDQTLNASGQQLLSSTNYWHKANTVMQLKLYSSLLDSGGRPVSRISKTYALPAKQLVGIRPLFEDDLAPFDGSANFEVILTDGKRKLAAQELMVKLVRERRDYHWRYSESEGWTSNYTEHHYDVLQRSVTLKAGSSAQVSVPVDWGHYRIEVSNPQTKVTAAYRFRAGWSADETVMAGRPDRIGLALDKQHYKVGETVTLDIKPAARGQGFLLVESDKVLYRAPLEVSENGKSVSFTVQSDWNSHDIYVSVYLVQPGEERDEKLPRRMMGIAHLPLDRQARKLEISIDSPASIRPNSRLVVPLSVSQGLTVPHGPVQVTLAAVDVGILNISKFAAPDPFAGFFEKRAYSVTARDSFSDLMSADDGVMAQLSFGGDEDSQNTGEADPDVEIVSLFSGVVDVDASGKVNVSLDIPNFNGRLRLMAVAFSSQSFGSAEKDVQVVSPIIAQLSKPRFLREGDESWLAVDLKNLSGSDQQLDLSLRLGQGLKFKGLADAQLYQAPLQLVKDAKRVLRLPIIAQAEFKDIDITLVLEKVQQKERILSIEKRWQLAVKPSWAKSEKLWIEALQPGQSFTTTGDELAQMIDFGLSGQLSLSSAPPLDIASHLQALEAYPYGCLEQTTSGVFPQLYVNDQLLNQLGIKGSDHSARVAAINLAIQRLQSMQRSSGGFGLWSAHSPEEHWLSVYVTDFLLRAKALGYPVPKANLDKARQRIAVYLRSPNKIRSYEERINHQTKFAVRAYAAQVLARYQQAPLSVLRPLFDHKENSESPMALLQLAMALDQSGDKKRANQAMQEALANIDKFGEPYIHYSSAVRDLALASFWLLENKQQESYWLPLLLQLTQQLSARQWLSTQERNALFLLGKELKLREEGDLVFKASIGTLAINSELQQQIYRLTPEQLRQPIAIENTAQSHLYVNIRASGYEKSVPQAINNGLDIVRTFYDINGQPFTDQQLQSGEKLIVGLQIQADKRLTHAMIVDLLPAGFEIENQNFVDSYQQTELAVNGVSLSEKMAGLHVKHIEYRADRFVMALDLARGSSTLFYLVRAVSAGTYRIPATFAEDMYRPEIRHTGKDAGFIKVLPRATGAR